MKLLEHVTILFEYTDLDWTAFQTAVALASFEAKQNEENVPTVTEDHFSQVVEMSTSFKEYMRSALQDNDADLAFRNRLRNDSFKLVPVERWNSDRWLASKNVNAPGHSFEGDG